MTVADFILPARRLAAAGTDAGLSNDAADLRRLTRRAIEEFFPDVTVSEPSFEILRRLDDVYGSARIEGWDGQGAIAVSALTYDRAKELVSLLPTTVPLPDVSADPDGELSLEWHMGRWRVFAISIGSTGRLSYAGIFGQARVHGTEYFDEELPPAITVNLRRLFAQRRNV